MNTSKLPLFFLGLLGIGVFLVAGCSYARADGVSLQIQNISPTGAISPGTTVSFYASASGFVDPTYSVADSFSASGSRDHRFGH
jgi:hypothetical protein